MEKSFNIGDFVCAKDNPNEIFQVIGYSDDYIGIQSKNGRTQSIEKPLLVLVPNEDDRVLNYICPEEFFLDL